MAKPRIVQTEDTFAWETKSRIINPVIDYFDGNLYLGIYVPCHRSQKVFKGEEITEEVSLVRLPAIIQHNEAEGTRRIELLDTKTKLAHGLEFSGIHADTDRWHHKQINDFIEEEHSQKTFQETYDEIKDQLKYYIELGDEREYDLVVCWIVATYFHQTFNTFPYLFLNATKQAGKTKLLTFCSCLAFNAVPTLCQTGASLFRMTQVLRPTFLLDETEKFGKKDENDYRSLLLARYKKGMKIWRIEEENYNNKKVRVAKGYEVYGPTLLSNISGLDEVLEDRTINITLKRTKNFLIANREVAIDGRRWEEYRNLLYLNLFQNDHKIRQLYKIITEIISYYVEGSEGSDSSSRDSSSSSSSIDKKSMDEFFNTSGFTSTSLYSLLKLPKRGVRARDMELWIPILCIAITRSEALYNNLLELAVEKTKEKSMSTNFSTLESILIREMLIMVDGSKLFYCLKDLSEAMATSIVEEEGADAKEITPRTVSRILSRLGFKDKRKINGRTQIYLSRAMVEDIAERLGVVLEDKVEDVEGGENDGK